MGQQLLKYAPSNQTQTLWASAKLGTSMMGLPNVAAELEVRLAAAAGVALQEDSSVAFGWRHA